jgi:hypothetical protein
MKKGFGMKKDTMTKMNQRRTFGPHHLKVYAIIDWPNDQWTPLTHSEWQHVCPEYL